MYQTETTISICTWKKHQFHNPWGFLELFSIIIFWFSVQLQLFDSFTCWYRWPFFWHIGKTIISKQAKYFRQILPAVHIPDLSPQGIHTFGMVWFLTLVEEINITSGKVRKTQADTVDGLMDVEGRNFKFSVCPSEGESFLNRLLLTGQVQILLGEKPGIEILQCRFQWCKWRIPWAWAAGFLALIARFRNFSLMKCLCCHECQSRTLCSFWCHYICLKGLLSASEE